MSIFFLKWFINNYPKDTINMDLIALETKLMHDQNDDLPLIFIFLEG